MLQECRESGSTPAILAAVQAVIEATLCSALIAGKQT